MIDDDDDRLASRAHRDGTTSDPAGVADPGSPETAAVAAKPDKAASPAIDVQSYIGRQLRAVYDDVAQQPVPERFLALMRQLEEKAVLKAG